MAGSAIAYMELRSAALRLRTGSLGSGKGAARMIEAGANVAAGSGRTSITRNRSVYLFETSSQIPPIELGCLPLDGLGSVMLRECVL